MKKINSILYFSLVVFALLTACSDDDAPAVDAPVASAGTDQTVDLETLVTLNGSASSGESLEFSWEVTDPSGNMVAVVNGTTDMPSFRASLAGTYNATLTVTNAGGSTTSTSMVTTVNPTFELEDQMGRPAINTVFNFFNSASIQFGPTTRDAFNQVLPSEGVPAADFAATLNALQTYIGLDPALFENILGIGNDALAGVLVNDVLTSDKSAPTSYATLNGRGLPDDVIDVTLLLTFSDQSDQGDPNGLIPGLISDNVQENDVEFSDTFPYLANPQ
ncbi:MAG: PKD domain-containing protein [Bacteroidota bacterium]